MTQTPKPKKDSNGLGRLTKRLHDNDPYDFVEPWAKWIKTLLQMIIAVWTLVYIGRMLHRDVGIPRGGESAATIGDTVLLASGIGLAIAAAVELAYTLFTDGPDEAITPLRLGVSAAGLITVSGTGFKLTPSSAGALILVILALALLFEIDKRHDLSPEKRESRWARPPAGPARGAEDG